MASPPTVAPPTPPPPATQPQLQSPLTLVLPLKSKEAADAVRAALPAAQNAMVQALLAQNRTHFARFMFLGPTDLALITSYDGDFESYIDVLAAAVAPVLNQLLALVSNPPPLPVENNLAAFRRYAQAQNAPTAVWYRAYPTLTVPQIQTGARAAGLDPGNPTAVPVQNALASVMDVKSPQDAAILRQMMEKTLPKVLQALAAVGTVHFGQFQFFANETKFAIITAYDGDFAVYIKAFVQFLGPIFDIMLGHVDGGEGLVPVESNPDAFVAYVAKTNVAPETWYSGYPLLTVKNILAAVPA